MIKKTRVGLDSGPYFPATVEEGVRWNGWACPTFDRETAEQVVAYVEQQTAEHDGEGWPTFLWTTDREGVAVLVEIDWDGDTPYYDVVGDDRKGYGIGAFSWTWHEEGDYDQD